MWLERILRRIRKSDKPLVLVGGEPYGTPFVIDALARERRLAWMMLHPAHRNDYVALGNLLAEAVNKALQANLLSQALPYTFGVDLLKEQLPRIGQLTLVCSGADFNPSFAEALAGLQSETCSVILDSSAPLPLDMTTLPRSELALTLAEAEGLNHGALDESQLKMLYQSSQGAYYTFLAAMCRIRGEPTLIVPHPGGASVSPEDRVLLSVDDLLATLLHLKRYEEALNLAVMSAPERVAGMIDEAGPVYQEKGLLSVLHMLLESLDDVYKASENVLAWRLVAGVSVDDYNSIIPEIEAHLGHYEAPTLRARYAGTITDMERRVAEATRAAGTQPSPLTFFQLGRLHPDTEKGIEILRNSVKLAETYGRPYEVARNAGALAQRLLEAGQFEQASYWAEWALNFFDRNELQDGARRLELLNTWAYSRILIGQTVGLEPLLKEAVRGLQHTELGLKSMFLSTLGELELVLGHLGEAERIARENVRNTPRQMAGERAAALVRVLLERGEFERALEEGRRATELTAGESEEYALPACLALGMAQAVTAPAAASAMLEAVMNAAVLSFEHRLTAALYLALTHKGDLAQLPEAQLQALRSVPLGGLRLLSGPAHLFTPIWQRLRDQEVPLHISALGQRQVLYRGTILKLSPRLFEILTLLCLNPGGLSLEGLHTLLYGESAEATPAGLNVSVSRLRKLIPITPQPYRISESYNFDVAACQARLNEGRLRDALELYRGPLLYESDAPGIAQARAVLEEQVRQAALQAKDPEALFALSETLGDDQELWEATLKALNSGDPRIALVYARQRAVQSF